MKLKRYTLLLTVFLCCCACVAGPERDAVIPRPVSVRQGSGSFKIRGPLAFDAPQEVAGTLAACLRAAQVSCRTDRPEAAVNYLHFELSDAAALPASGEGYCLLVRPEGVTVRSRGTAGLFYGLQTFLQLHAQYGTRIPAREITDAPRFAYRGLHLDVSRHFFDKEFVKKQLRMMASLKLNRLHWHLTDGAGWRIEIDHYPLLTSVAAWRRGATWQEWQAGGRRYCRFDEPGASGGYYTKADIREVVAFADSLHITVIPEIELPGHSDEVLAVYPELSCSGKPYTDGDFCIGNDATFVFLENVLAEVMELFPSEYIHIGGDEASKTAWAGCPKCRARMKRENLQSLDELQSYAVHRIERFLGARGRKLIGWDEILDGGLAPGAVVMSWRGEEGGRRAAAAGHDVVMTPNAWCYFDSYQDNPTTEPQAMSGYLPLAKVYAYDPAPAGMPGCERVLGVQANLWTEQIPTPRQAEYMLYPRLFALSEVAWSPSEAKDYADFHRRALLRNAAVRAQGYAAFDLASEYGERREAAEPVGHLAVGCPVSYATPWSDRYPAEGAATLTDGLRGPWSYGSRWQGFLDSDVEVTVDLGAVKPIREVAADFIQWYSAWIWLPVRVEIAVSDDGAVFRPLCAVENDYPAEAQRPEYRTFGWQGADKARYIRYHAVSAGRPGGWLFTDEIRIN